MASRRQRFAQRRKAVGFSQEGLAERLGVDRSTVVRWEAGDTEPQPWLRPKLARVLQVSIERLDDLLTETGESDALADERGAADPTMREYARLSLGLAPARLQDEPQSSVPTGTAASNPMLDIAQDLEAICRVDLADSAPAPVIERGMHAAKSDLDSLERAALSGYAPVPIGDQAGRRIDHRHVDQIEAAARMFRDWDNRFGGGLRRKAVIGQVNEADRLLSGPFVSKRAGRRLFSAVADLAQLAGWMSFDMGLQEIARRHFVLGLHLAREAGDRLQVARMLYCLARQMVDLDRPGDGLDVVQTALYATRRVATPRVRSMLLVMEARAHAKRGEPRECHRALGLAHEAFSDSDSSTEPGWMSFFDEAELAGLSGVALRDLARRDVDHERAHASITRPYLVRATEQRSTAYLRSHVLDLDALTTADLLLGEPERAGEAMTQAIGLAERISSPRVVRNLGRTVSLARHRYAGLGVFDELAERAQAIMGDQPS